MYQKRNMFYVIKHLIKIIPCYLYRKKRGFQEEIQQGFHCTNHEIFSSLGIELADNRKLYLDTQTHHVQRVFFYLLRQRCINILFKLGCNSTSTYVEPVYKLRRLNSASYRRGLSILLNTKSEEYFVTSDDFIGFKVSCGSIGKSGIDNFNANKQFLM